MAITTVRVLFYVLSYLLNLGGAWMADWGVSYTDGFLHISVETALGALVSSVAMSMGVFKKWGVW